MRATSYAIADAHGVVQATHHRVDGPDGKRLWWELPDGTTGLGGRRVETLPMHRTELVAREPRSRTVVVCEGERAADAVARTGLLAVGTVTGAASCHLADAVAELARGRRFVVWPDLDEPGLAHAARQARQLARAGAAGVVWIRYAPTVPEAAWPPGTDAADLLEELEPAVGRELVRWLVDAWAEPVPAPAPELRRTRKCDGRRLRTSSWDEGSVTAALSTRYGLEARPGRSVRCPVHDDRHASLSVLADDRRAVCHADGCAWSGRGVIAKDIQLELVR